MKGVYPESRILMIEANPNCAKELSNQDAIVEIALLGSESGLEKTYYTVNGGDSSGNSTYRERTSAYDDERCTALKMITQTLDEIVESHGMKPDFLKLDVQGAELDVLLGGEKVISTCEFILLEVGMAEFNAGSPTFFQILSYMDQVGFEIFDLVELKYLPYAHCMCGSANKRLNEMDILFVRKGTPYRKNLDKAVGLIDR